MVMEVETRLPLSGPPSRPLSEGPSYSPITPERGLTPEQQLDDGRATGAEPVGDGEGQVDNSHGSVAALAGDDGRVKDAVAAQTATSADATVAHAHAIAATTPGTAISRDQKLELGQGTGLSQQQLMQQSVQHALGGGMAIVNGNIKPTAPLDYSLHAASMDANPFPDGNPAFQTIDTQALDDMDSGIPPLVDDSAFMESAASVQDSEPNRIRAFAKLEFDDGQFYMNTYAIEIGRDRDAARQAERKKIQEHDRRGSDGSRRDGSNPDLERAQKHADPALSAAASVISGGIMHMGAEERLKRKKKRSKSTGSSSKGAGQREASTIKGTTDYQALANASLLDRNHARPVDLTNMMPSPDECPLIPIHPPPTTESGLTGHKGISRKHVRIAYNHEKGLFELHVLGKNGCFIDGAHMESGEVVALASGTDIQIGGVSMRFILPNVPDGETGTDLRSDAVSQSAMSFDFEDGRGESAAGDQDSETPTTDNEDDRYRELREAQKAEALLLDDDDDDDEDDDDGDEEDEEDEDEGEPEEIQVDVRKPRPKIMLKLSSKSKPKPVEEEPAPPKRKVGRPPKNGIMSKREEAEIRRREKELAKAKAKAKGKGKDKGDRERGGKKKKQQQAEEPDEVQVKAEADDLEEEPPSPTERRKSSKKKKPEEPTEAPGDVVESIEKDQSETPADSAPQQSAPAPKPKKERPAKPPRSPSPVFNEAELTPEQLAKPSQSYVVLIHEALSNHPDGRMSLPQIYRAIERKYPYYKLRVQTVGWQSSVRHNLSQHPAFKKIERDGKGWMWGLDPSVSIEREKKRRPSPPPMQAPGWSAPGSNTFNRTFPQSVVYPGNNGQMPQNPYAMFPNGHPPPPPGRGFPPPGSLPRPPFPGSQQQQPPSTPPMYQSPYGSNRPPGQSPAEGNQTQSQQPNQAVPQMPAPYLNQAQRPPNGAAAATTTTEGPANSQAQQTARPGQAQNATATAQRPAIPRPSPQVNTQVPNHGPQVPSPQARPPTQASPAFSPPPNNPYGIPQNIWVMIERFRGALKTTMGKVPDGEAMLNQAINKCIGLKEGYRTFEKESSIITPLKNMLVKFNWPVDGMIAYAEGRSATRPVFAPPAPPPPPPSASPAGPAATAQSPGSATSLPRPPSVPAPSPVGNVPAPRPVQQAPPPPPPSASVRPNPPPPLPPQYKAPSPQQQQHQRPVPPTTQPQTQTSVGQNNAAQPGSVRPGAPTATPQSGQPRVPDLPQQSGQKQASSSSGGQTATVPSSMASAADASKVASAAPAPSPMPSALASATPANQSPSDPSGTQPAAASTTLGSSVAPTAVASNGAVAGSSAQSVPASGAAAANTTVTAPPSNAKQTEPATNTIPTIKNQPSPATQAADAAPEPTLKRPRPSDGAGSGTEAGESNGTLSRVEGEPPAKKLAQ